MLLGKPEPGDYNIHPSHYPWAKDLYDQAVRNTWFPHEIALKEDLDDWAKMTEDERHAVEFLISFFNPSELIVNRVTRARRLSISQVRRMPPLSRQADVGRGQSLRRFRVRTRDLPAGSRQGILAPRAGALDDRQRRFHQQIHDAHDR